MRAWTGCRSRLKKTWSARSCVLRRCASSAGSDCGTAYVIHLARDACIIVVDSAVRRAVHPDAAAAAANSRALRQSWTHARGRRAPARLAPARPQTVVSLPRIEGTVILAFDVSGSMAADDMKPTRMEAAKAAARGFVQRQPASVQIGVVAFSDNGFAVQAPTNDQEAILASINRLTPQRGTSLANGILASLNTIAAGAGAPLQLSSNRSPTPTPTPVPKGAYTSAVIVLLTDGENTVSPDPLAAAPAAPA